MKKYKPLDNYDFSGYAEEISGDALFKINGGAEIENSNKGVANAKPGDTLTRNDGTTVTITQGDIDWAKKQVGESETTATNSTPTSVTETSNSQPQQTSSSTTETGKTNTTTKSGNNSTSAVSSTGTKSTESSVIQETAATAEQTTSSARTSSEYQGVPPQYWDALDEQKAKRQLEEIKSENKEQINQEKQLKSVRQFSLGVRGSFVVGGSLSVGIVLNPNNYWDSGIIGSIGIGTGVEVGVNVPLTKPLSTIVENTISVAASCVDFSSPKSTQDLEGSHNTAYASALFGIAHDLDTNRISGIEVLSVGGGVYREKTNILTIGELVESIYNTGAFFANTVYKYTGINKSISYIELDGQ
ncbi:MAG: hypothetical protein MJ176_04400 [Treponema sp.]|nr:hypothetical protein [Treponema sp.]